MRPISACFRNLDETDWRVLQSIREKHGLKWREFVHQLATYPEMVNTIMSLPSEVDPTTHVNINTINNLLPTWMENISKNFENVRNGKDIRDIPKSDSRALVIGAGPSLYRRRHLELLSEKEFDGVIFAADRAVKDCLDHGVVPDYIMVLDGSEKILKYIDHNIVDEFSDSMGAIMCLMAHPSVVDRWNGNIFWFSNAIDGDAIPNVSYMLHLLLKKTELFTAGHSSSVGWSVAYTIGCRDIGLIGLDLSYPSDVPKEETWYYDRYYRAFNGDEVKIDAQYKNYHHSVFDTDCYFDPVFENYLFCSLAHFKTASDMGCKIVNCTEGGAIEGEGVRCMKFNDWLTDKRFKKITL